MNIPKTVLLLFLVFLYSNSFTQEWKNLVFEGGGIRGIAYAGAIDALEKNNLTNSIEQVAGTSVGAVVAGLLAVDYRANEIKQIMYHLKLQQFNDGQFIFVGGANRFIKRYGWYRGNKLENWVGVLLKNKTGNADITFAQLHQLHLKDKRYKDLTVTATNLSQQKLTLFSWETYPDMKIKTAIRTSISIPLYFSAVKLNSKGHVVTKKNEPHEVFVDGGVLANYPLTVFDKNGVPNLQTLGVKLERPEQLAESTGRIASYNIVNFRSYVSALYNVILENLNRDSSYIYEKPRTIYISTGNIAPKVRRMSTGQKNLLYQNGVEGVELFLNTKR